MRPSDQPDKKSGVGELARYSEIGFIIPAAVLLGYGLGRLADWRLGTTWLYLAGVIFGAVVGFVQMMRMVAAWTRESEKASGESEENG